MRHLHRRQQREHRQPGQGLQGHGDLKDPPASLRPGLNATADIETARKAAVWPCRSRRSWCASSTSKGKVVDPGAVSADAAPSETLVSKRDLEEKEGVFVVVEEEAAFRPVKTGILGEADIEIADGLKQAEEIVTGSYKTLRTLKNEARIKAEMRKERR